MHTSQKQPIHKTPPPYHQDEAPCRINVRPLIYLAIIALIALLLFITINPTHTAFFPQCMVRKLTGLSCPGCGTARASYGLLHGHFVDAMRFNLLYLPAILLIVLLFLSSAFAPCSKAMKRCHNFLSSSKFIWGVFIVVVLWAIVRNLLHI